MRDDSGPVMTGARQTQVHSKGDSPHFAFRHRNHCHDRGHDLNHELGRDMMRDMMRDMIRDMMRNSCGGSQEGVPYVRFPVVNRAFFREKGRFELDFSGIHAILLCCR